jgi:hypothetical protein
MAMIAQSVAEILRNHVSLSVEGIDRMYLNVYVPTLQRDKDVACFFAVTVVGPSRPRR